MSGNNRRVRVQIGRTIQPKAFESMRIDFAVEEDLPVGVNMDTFIDNTIKYFKEKLAEYGVGFNGV